MNLQVLPQNFLKETVACSSSVPSNACLTFRLCSYAVRSLPSSPFLYKYSFRSLALRRIMRQRCCASCFEVTGLVLRRPNLAARTVYALFALRPKMRAVASRRECCVRVNPMPVSVGTFADQCRQTLRSANCMATGTHKALIFADLQRQGL